MLFTPRWIASHVFALGLVVAFVFAGLWQLNRLNERRDTNDQIRERLATAPTQFDGNDGSSDRLEYQALLVEGTFDATRQLLVANRSEDGSPGFWAWTVLSVDGGGEILVNRGFLPRALEGDPSVEPTPTPVTIVGLVRFGLSAGAISDDGAQISRPNATLALEHLNVANVLTDNAYLQMLQQEPPEKERPRPVPIPDLGEGPHRSYAIQWFTFATIGLVGYALVLRRIRRGDESLGDVGLKDRIDSAHESEPQGV